MTEYLDAKVGLLEAQIKDNRDWLNRLDRYAHACESKVDKVAEDVGETEEMIEDVNKSYLILEKWHRKLSDNAEGYYARLLRYDQRSENTIDRLNALTAHVKNLEGMIEKKETVTSHDPLDVPFIRKHEDETLYHFTEDHLKTYIECVIDRWREHTTIHGYSRAYAIVKSNARPIAIEVLNE